MIRDDSNIIFRIATDLVNQSSRHIFLTGKAGTGKTTFLRYIKENSFKKMAIVAPTGVAAINAGGMTMHSFFQLPVGYFIPTSSHVSNAFDELVHNKHTLLKNLRLNASKRELLRELDLVIIDEVSMVRADMLDATDTILRHVRRQHNLPFGGVQMLYIGDLFQLPPVVKNDQWDVLKEYYRSPFFFDAKVMEESQPVNVELKHIYRQSDNTFISILNNIRNNQATEDDLLHLHQHYKPGFSAPSDERYIILTTHNEKADIINKYELQRLTTEQFVFEAEIHGEFSEKAYPAEQVLNLKEGAQIMFLKNDRGELRRYFNGKIGTIKSIEKDAVMIAFEGENDLLKLEKETWRNIRYQYDHKTDSIKEEELGSFSQFPIRLAWAITIHKSQGLTFDRAIIDAGQAFAPGQVYVALSRLTGLDGLVLRSPIYQHSIKTDQRVLDFTRNELSTDILQEILEQEKITYTKEILIKCFSWIKTKDMLEQHLESDTNRKLDIITAGTWFAQNLLDNVNQLHDVGNKFQRQLDMYFREAEQKGYDPLYQRTSAACDYFIKEMDEKLIAHLKNHIEKVSKMTRVKKYLSELRELELHFERRKKQFQQIKAMAELLQNSEDGPEQLMQAVQQQPEPSTDEGLPKEIVEKKKRVIGETQKASLNLFKEGKSVSEIATERGLAFSTIESHLAGFVISGEIDVLELVKQPKLDKILEVFYQHPEFTSTSQLKHELGDDFSYGEIKAAMKYREKMDSEKVE